MEKNKEKIIELFRNNIKGKLPDVSKKHIGHDGKYGHWLEEQFGILANATNGADFLGYELKMKHLLKLLLVIGQQTDIYSKMTIIWSVLKG